MYIMYNGYIITWILHQIYIYVLQITKSQSTHFTPSPPLLSYSTNELTKKMSSILTIFTCHNIHIYFISIIIHVKQLYAFYLHFMYLLFQLWWYSFIKIIASSCVLIIILSHGWPLPSLPCQWHCHQHWVDGDSCCGGQKCYAGERSDKKSQGVCTTQNWNSNF